MQIRAFGGGDEEAVVALWELCGLTRPWNDPRKDIARKLKVDADLFLVGVVDGRIVASAMAGYDGHRGWVNYLAVAPQFRRRGFGVRMMAAIETALRTRGCPKINLQIRSSNAAATGFYRALGYATDDVISMGKRSSATTELSMESEDALVVLHVAPRIFGKRRGGARAESAEASMAIRIVRLGSKRLKGEGLRIGTVRRPPRGVRRSKFAVQNWYDVWLPALAPAADTVKLAQQSRSARQWAVFARRYRAEMATAQNSRILDLLAALSHRTNFSLGCYCEDEARCHRSILRQLLLDRKASVK